VKFHELFISRYFVRFLNVDFMRSMLSKVCECSFHDDCEHSFCFKGDFFLFIVSYLVSIVAWHWLLNVNYCLPSPIVPSHHLSLLFVTNYYHCLLSQGIVVWSFLLVVIDGYYMPLSKVHVHLLLLFPSWSYSSLVIVVVDILLSCWISPPLPLPSPSPSPLPPICVLCMYWIWTKWSSFNLQPQTTNKVSFTFFFKINFKKLFFFLFFSYGS
jgi:hypothetical protein